MDFYYLGKLPLKENWCSVLFWFFFFFYNFLYIFCLCQNYNHVMFQMYSFFNLFFILVIYFTVLEWYITDGDKGQKGGEISTGAAIRMYNTCPSVCVYACPKEHQRFCRVQSSPSSCAEVTLVSLCFAFHVSLVFFLWAEMCPRLSNMLTATLWSGGAWLTFKRTFPRRQQRAFL